MVRMAGMKTWPLAGQLLMGLGFHSCQEYNEILANLTIFDIDVSFVCIIMTIELFFLVVRCCIFLIVIINFMKYFFFLFSFSPLKLHHTR